MTRHCEGRLARTDSTTSITDLLTVLDPQQKLTIEESGRPPPELALNKLVKVNAVAGGFHFLRYINLPVCVVHINDSANVAW